MKNKITIENDSGIVKIIKCDNWFVLGDNNLTADISTSKKTHQEIFELLLPFLDFLISQLDGNILDELRNN